MRRLRSPHPGLLVAAALLALTVAALTVAAPAFAAGPPFPDPVAGQAVYDPAEAISAATEAALEGRIDAIEARSGAEIVVYLQVKPDISEEQNFDDARALMDQWGVGRKGFDDGLVIMLGLDESRLHGRISVFGGSGFLNAYINEDGLASIIDQQMVPAARNGDLDAALLNALDAISPRVTSDGRARLETMRQVNAVLGLVVAPMALLGLIAAAFLAWRRDGDDPEYIDSPSILMAGPPADMTPALSTVIQRGRATQHSLDTVLMELASRGRIAFSNLDQVKKSRSDSEPDPLLDPAILVAADPSDDRPMAAPEQLADRTIQQLALGSDRLTRSSLWALNGSLRPVKPLLEREALRLGWFAHLPGPAITRWTVIGAFELVLGVVVGIVGVAIPMSGATVLGGALGVAGLVTAGFGQAMSKRTPNGAMVDGMLKAYRRTLHKTLQQARSMTDVVADETIHRLADTPDKAVVWGFALGLHDEVSAVIERNLSDQREGRTTTAYYPYWLNSSSASGISAFAGAPGGGATVMPGSGSGFSGSSLPDVGGMFSALGSIGSTPPSSSSGSGGGFGGGGSSGGGGASGSF